jgi:cytoskeleton protein RodZ
MSEQHQAEEAVVAEAGFEASPAVGSRLRDAREARGISLHEMAHTLKLGVRQVEALETGDWQALPGHTFIRGFVRNYARLVEMDPAPLMLQLDRTLEKPVSRLESVESGSAVMPNSGRAVTRRDRNMIFTGLGAVLFAGVLYIALPSDLSALHESMQAMLDSFSRKEEPVVPADVAVEPVMPPGATTQQVLNPQAEAPVAPPTLEQTPSSAVTVAPSQEQAVSAQEIRQQPAGNALAPLRFVFEKESWVDVKDRDNKALMTQRNAAGSEQVISGNGPFTLVIGNAPSVKLFWRGQLVDLVPHTRGDVARLVLE